MDCSDPASEKGKTNSEAECSLSRKPRILLGVCGSVGAAKFSHVCGSFAEWAEVKAVVTTSSLSFIPDQTLPKDVVAYCDYHEWNTWKKIGDPVLHIELRNWADIMVIAPLSSNTLGKIAGGMCDNLLTCIVRAWDYKKPFLVAPSMNTFAWKNSSTEKHLIAIAELGIILIPPVPVCRDLMHAMAEPSTINSTVKASYDGLKMKQKEGGSTSTQVFSNIEHIMV